MTKEKMIQKIVEEHFFGGWAIIEMILAEMFPSQKDVDFGAGYFYDIAKEMDE